MAGGRAAGARGAAAAARAAGGAAAPVGARLPELPARGRKEEGAAPQGAGLPVDSPPEAPMNLVFVAAEVAPWSKTGGLGDVMGGLPVELAARGHKVMTVAPRYDQYEDAWDTSVVIDVMGEPVRFFHSLKDGVDRVFVDHPWFLAKVWGKTASKLYGKKAGADYADNQKRFRLFCEAAIEAARALPCGPGEECTFVANDWHSALVPVLLKDVYQPAGEFAAAKCALCVHNIAFQGRFWREQAAELALPEASLQRFLFADGYPKIFSELEPAEETYAPPPTGAQFEKLNWLQAGFQACDKALTVSPNYAREVTADNEKGVELQQTLERVGIEGIVNGMDETDWNPATDKYLEVNFDKDSVHAGKAAAKEALQAECGLPVDPDVPVFGFIGRLEEQKGVDILMEALPGLVEAAECQVVILGTGKKAMETQLKALSAKFPGRVKGIAKFSTPLAHTINAGADFLLVPSRFEPCGLIQLHAMQYGTVPIVATTGGLVDTVKEGVTGFHMGRMDPDDLVPADVAAVTAACVSAAAAFETEAFDGMVERCIAQDLSWSKPAKKWEAALEEMMGARAVNPTPTQKKESVVTPVAAV